VNGATLHLTIKGKNTLTAGFGGAGIAVPDGCTLEITAASDGTLHATGGKNYGGGAGIGSIGDHNNTNQGSNLLFPQGLGTITINGGTIYAKGGTWYNMNYAAGGAAGIGSSELSGATTTDSSWGGTTYINNTRAASPSMAARWLLQAARGLQASVAVTMVLYKPSPSRAAR
jgi:hypothetical protein